MAPVAHLLLSWTSCVEFLKNRRERTIVALSGIAPDIDGLGVIIDKLTGTTSYFLKFHHYIGHSIFAAVIFSTVACAIASSQRKTVWVFSFIVVHLHIICDVLGSKGPDGYHWPVYYLYPINSEFQLNWRHQWELNAWPNQVIVLLLFVVTIYYAATRRITFLEIFSTRLNAEACSMHQKYVHKNY